LASDGSRASASSLKKKRQELDIAAATNLHKLYGEFKEVSRLWRASLYDAPNPPKIAFPAELLLQILRDRRPH
jgi:hypothetical protein